MHAQTDTDAAREFADIVGESQLLTGERIGPDYHHDEALVGEPVAPRFVARPQTAEQVAALLAAATRAQMPVTARREPACRRPRGPARTACSSRSSG